jgi:preprotein translocase subunit YajC
MFIATAYAQSAGAPAPGIDYFSFLPFVLILVVFYFLLFRPQQQKAKQHKLLIESVRRGDRVVTGGGMLGVVTKVFTNDEVQVEIADGVRVRVIKSTIASVTSRTGAVPTASARSNSKDDDEQEVEEEAAEPDSREAKKR